MIKPTAGANPSAAGSVLASVQERLADHLSAVEQVLAAELQSENPYVRDILQHVTRFQGKRLRPVLLLLAADAAGGINNDHHVLAAVVEMIHIATLVHDDVLDEASTRRHVATVNSRWNNETSVLFGDFLFTHAFHLASSLETTFGCRQIGRATNLVCEGELTQVHERGNLDLSEAQYFEIINGKTAELCALCGLLGAHYAGASQQVIEQMEQFGRLLGLAFQIADDVLDLVGTEQRTGKSLGSDLDKQKLTLPVIHLLQTGDQETVQRVKQLILSGEDSARNQVAAALEAHGSLHYAQSRAQQLAEDARACLQILPANPARQILEQLAEFAVQRTF